MNYKKFIGIDPGKTGGIAVIDSDNKILYMTSIPCTQIIKKKKKHRHQDNMTLSQILTEHVDVESYVTVESTHAHPGEGACSSFDFGWNVGSIDGILNSLNTKSLIDTETPINFAYVSPMKWKAALALTISGSTREERKKASVEMANRIFNIRLTLRQDGVAEALLIAMYGKNIQSE